MGEGLNPPPQENEMAYQKIKGMMSDGQTSRFVQVDKEGRLVMSPSTEGLWLTAAIAKAGTTSNTVDLGDSFMYMRVIIPTLDACTVKVQVAETATSTYYNLDAVTTASSTHNYATTFLIGGYRFIKLVTSAAQSTAAVEIKVSGLGVY